MKDDTLPTPAPLEQGLDLSAALGDALAAVEALARHHTGGEEPPERDTQAQPQAPVIMPQIRGLPVAAGREVQDLRDQVKTLQGENAQLRSQIAQSAEQVASMRRMVQRQEADLPLQATRRILDLLLTPLDHMAALGEHLRSTEALTDQDVEAVAMMQTEWQRVAQRLDLEAFDAVGLPFDPDRHELIGRQHDPSQPAGVVLRQAGRGYLWNGKVLRAAPVVVNALRG